jgi:hypothetical protein
VRAEQSCRVCGIVASTFAGKRRRPDKTRASRLARAAQHRASSLPEAVARPERTSGGPVRERDCGNPEPLVTRTAAARPTNLSSCGAGLYTRSASAETARVYMRRSSTAAAVRTGRRVGR